MLTVSVFFVWSVIETTAQKKNLGMTIKFPPWNWKPPTTAQRFTGSDSPSRYHAWKKLPWNKITSAILNELGQLRHTCMTYVALKNVTSTFLHRLVYRNASVGPTPSVKNPLWLLTSLCSVAARSGFSSCFPWNSPVDWLNQITMPIRLVTAFIGWVSLVHNAPFGPYPLGIPWNPHP